MVALWIDRPIVLDGRFDEPEWQLAAPATDFIQQEPHSGQPATERTEVRILYDADTLYIAASCFDSAGREGVVVNELRLDYTPGDQDGFGFVLDTFADGRNGFLFGVNPKGARYDAQVGSDGASSNRDWHTRWYVKTTIDDTGWHAEIAVPFRSLRFNRQGETWGINFVRRVRRKNEESYWSPLPRPFRLPRVSLAGRLNGVKDVKPGRNLYVKPYVLGANTAREAARHSDFDVGLDLKYGLTSQLTLDLTLNTDFAHVEEDEQQLNLTRFSLFFPEKREFFLENSILFQFGRPSTGGSQVIPFFSRRIGIANGQPVPIRGGAKLSGKAGSYSLGMLSIATDRHDGEPPALFTVARLRRELLRKSDIGVILVDKHQSNGNVNRTIGADANLTLLGNLDITSSWLQTTAAPTPRDNQSRRLAVAWRDPLINVAAEYQSVGRNFNPEVGFVARKAMSRRTVLLGVTPRPGPWLPGVRELQPAVRLDHITSPEGLLESQQLDGRLGIQFTDGSSLTVSRVANFERLFMPFTVLSRHSVPAGDYRFDEWSVGGTTDTSRMFSGTAAMTTGEFYNGRRNAFQAGVRVQPGYRFRVELSLRYEDVRLAAGASLARLVAARLSYSFSTNAFLDVLVQYNEETHGFASNVRLNLIHHPLSNFFIVYNHTTGSVIARDERAVVAKLTQLISF